MKKTKIYIDDEVFNELTLEKFEIWEEGFRIGNIIQEATMHGSIDGKNFEEACLKFFKGDINYNYRKNTFNGNRLFEKEEDARLKELELNKQLNNR